MKKLTIVKWVDKYLDFKRQLGFALEVEGQQLKRFANFSKQTNHQGPLTLTLAILWAHHNTTNDLTSARRIEIIRPFAKYLLQFEPDTEIPPTKLFGSGHRRLEPHIYYDHEIKAILDESLNLSPKNGLRPKTYQTIFGLLFSTGLRLSEALHLIVDDVDLKRSLILVRNTKYRKSRYIPLHKTTVKALEEYNSLRKSIIPITDRNDFFLMDNSRPLLRNTIERQFQIIRKKLHLKSRGGHPDPRVQDFRYPNLNKIQTFFISN